MTKDVLSRQDAILDRAAVLQELFDDLLAPPWLAPALAEQRRAWASKNAFPTETLVAKIQQLAVRRPTTVLILEEIVGQLLEKTSR